MGQLLDSYDCLGILPQLLQVVVASGQWQKNVHDNRAIVHKDPARCRRTFRMQCPDARFLQLCQYLLMDRLHLSLSSCLADHEVVSNGGEWSDIQQEDILPQLLHNDIHNGSCQVLRFQILPPFGLYARRSLRNRLYHRVRPNTRRTAFTFSAVSPSPTSPSSACPANRNGCTPDTD